MHIASFKIENYKSFRETPEIALTPGFNVIVGQNNVGKTALVEALSLQGGHMPHRSLEALPTQLTPVPAASTVRLIFRLGEPELRELLRDVVQPCWVRVGSGQHEQQAALAFNQAIRAVNDLDCTFRGGLSQAFLVNYGAFTGVTHVVQLKWRLDGSLEVLGADNRGLTDHCDHKLATVLQARIYAFRAERLNVGVCPFGQNTVLQSNAGNLAEVLDNLQADPAVFEELNALFGQIFPTVRRVTVRPAAGGQVEVLIWTVPPETRRLDLTMSLASCGTGFGQVLAMLYVVLTAHQPRFIVIDEPQSFLHPGAVRKLIEILKHYPQHQYIITTHSPTALTAADPETLLRLTIEDGQTQIERLDVKQARDLRILLADVGARLSDVFGADNVLWVEGLTEELCFPRIAARRGIPLRGTTVIGVVQTGDFEGRRSATTIEMYRRLSASTALLPPAVGFIFDREGRSDREREDLGRHGNLFFLSRRMYENYLLNAAAIAAVASSIEGFRDSPVAEAEVETWLEDHRRERRYFDPLPARADAWLSDVHGAKLLTDLFRQLSGTHVEYDKVRHGVALTEWLLDQAPEQLREVAQVIERGLGAPLLSEAPRTGA